MSKHDSKPHHSTETEFSLQEGYVLTEGKGGTGEVLSVTLPIHLAPGLSAKKVVEAVSKAPEHEVLGNKSVDDTTPF
jgi:hypothetical protein